MSLADKLVKNSTIHYTAPILDSQVFDKGDETKTPVIGVNIALSARVDGGLTNGLLCLAGESKRFKSLFALLIAASYLKAHPEGVLLFYDSEFGTPKPYFSMLDIDMSRVIHTPLLDAEELIVDIMKQLTNLERKDEIIIILDSMGNLASKKEVEDALKGETKADYTRAKAFKGLYRMITPHLNLKDIPMIVVNHTYKSIGSRVPVDIISGGTGIYLSADDIWIIGRRQDKDDDGLHGYEFIINIEKSRSVKEKSKIPISVNFDKGINRWSGLVDLALEAGILTKPSNGWYQLVINGKPAGSKSRLDDIETDDVFWTEVFDNTDFAQWIERKFSLHYEGKRLMSKIPE